MTPYNTLHNVILTIYLDHGFANKTLVVIYYKTVKLGLPKRTKPTNRFAVPKKGPHKNRFHFD